MHLWNILHPEFRWHTIPTVEQQQRKLSHSTTPPRQTVWAPSFWRRFFARHLHLLIKKVSIRYCKWYGIRFSGQISHLPFGLLLKWSDHTRLEEVLAMRTAGAAGLPIPWVISYAEHPDTPHAPVSILMTRIPGTTLDKELWEWFTPEEQNRIISQLKDFFRTIRQWKSPTEPRIYSVAGTAIRSARVPGRYIGPCKVEEEFNNILNDPMWFQTFSNYDETVARATNIIGIKHDLKFTHGDLAPHNLLVLDDGRISGFLDWEAAGWYPEYWDFTTACGISLRNYWWTDLVSKLFERNYDKERNADQARWVLSTGHMFW